MADGKHNAFARVVLSNLARAGVCLRLGADSEGEPRLALDGHSITLHGHSCVTCSDRLGGPGGSNNAARAAVLTVALGPAGAHYVCGSVSLQRPSFLWPPRWCSR